MPELSVLLTSGVFLGVSCVFTGFITTVSQQWAAHTNTTGVSEYGRARYHTFDHSFFMQTFLFLGQLSCLGVYRIIRKIRGPEPEPVDPVEAERQRRMEERRARARARANVVAQGGGAGAEGGERQQPGGSSIDARRADGNERPQVPGNSIEVYRRENGDVDNAQDDADRNELRCRRQEFRQAVRAPNPRLNRNRRQKEKKGFSKMVFLLPTLCIFARTGLLFVGVRQTYPSSFIMLQGVGLMSTCLLTVAFVGREKTVKKLHWVGGSICTAGLAVCGLVDFVWGHDHTYDPYGIAAGCLLIVMGHLMTAIQVILEQRFVKKHNIDPLVAVGLEGMFGSVILLVLLIPFYFVDVGAFNTLPKHRLEDPYDAFLQMRSQPLLIVAFIGSIVFFPFFYYCGVSITKHLDAVHRMGVEININIIAWLIYLMIGWEDTHPIQILGFALAFVGMVIFFLNPIIDRIKARRGGGGAQEPARNDDEAAPLLNPANPGVQGYGAQNPEVNRPM